MELYDLSKPERTLLLYATQLFPDQLYELDEDQLAAELNLPLPTVYKALHRLTKLNLLHQLESGLFDSRVKKKWGEGT